MRLGDANGTHVAFTVRWWGADGRTGHLPEDLGWAPIAQAEPPRALSSDEKRSLAHMVAWTIERFETEGVDLTDSLSRDRIRDEWARCLEEVRWGRPAELSFAFPSPATDRPLELEYTLLPPDAPLHQLHDLPGDTLVCWVDGRAVWPSG
jgi:hypothetical protein